MSRLAVAGGGATLGGVAGGIIAGPPGALLGAQLGFLGGAILANILFPTKIDVGGPSRDDVRISSAAIGRFIPIPYGVNRIGGQYIYLQEPLFVDQTEEVGGKGSGGADVTTTTMFLTFGTGICEGPILAVTRIWFDDTLVFDIGADTNPDGPAFSHQWLEQILAGNVSSPPGTVFTDQVQEINVQEIGPIRIYLGHKDQPVDPIVQSDPRIGEAFGGATVDFVPNWGGLAWAMFDRGPGEMINNHPPQVEFEVLTGGTDVFEAVHYEPVPSRTRTHIQKDRTSIAASDGATVYLWNYIDKNPETPTSYPIRFEDGSLASGISIEKPFNVGTWDDPDLIGFNGSTTLTKYNLNTGFRIEGGQSRSVGTSGQPVSIYYYPNTANPTRVISLYGTQNQIAAWNFEWGSDQATWAQTKVLRSAPTVSEVGIVSVSWHLDRPGIIAPDGLLYVVAGETSGTEMAILAIDPHSLDIPRALKPYKVSPETDDDFYASCEMTYDYDTDKIILFSSAGKARRVDRATLTVEDLPDIDIGVAFSNNGNEASLLHGPFNGLIWISGGFNNYKELDVRNWRLTGRSIPNAQTRYGIGGNNQVHSYDPINNGLWVQDFLDTDQLDFLPLGRRSPTCVTAGSIADDISDRVDVPSTLRDTSKWTDLICGYLIGRRISGRKALEALAGAINGDFRTQDGRVDFFKLDTASVKTIPEDDLGAAEAIDAKVPGRDIRWPYERELPARVDVQFVDRKMDFSSNTQGMDRPLEGFKGRGKETVQMPIVFDTDSDPKPIEIAERLLYSFDAHRRKHQLALTWEHLNLNVGDAFDYIKGNFTHTVRAEKWALAENNMVIIEAREEDVSVNTSSGEAGVTASAVFEPPKLIGANTSELLMIDSSLLRDSDDSATGIAIYVGAAPAGESEWPGANLQVTKDGGATWTTLLTFSRNERMAWGLASTALPDARVGVVDRTNSVTLTMRSGVLVGSAAETDLDEDRQLNALLIGRPASSLDASWEVVRYANNINASGSPDDEGDTYTISNLRRGQRGTDHHTAEHQAGDFVVVLDPSKLKRLVLETSEVGVERQYRLVTIGQPQALASPVSFTLVGESKKPYPLTDVQGSRNISTGVWTVTATRRTRISGAWIDFNGPPLGEDTEEYECEALSGPGGSVIATNTGLTSPSTTFTPAELGFSPDSDSPFSLTVRWYQISATIGRGNSFEVTLSSPTPGN